MLPISAMRAASAKGILNFGVHLLRNLGCGMQFNSYLDANRSGYNELHIHGEVTLTLDNKSVISATFLMFSGKKFSNTA
jgi:hypothetical protein